MMETSYKLHENLARIDAETFTFCKPNYISGILRRLLEEIRASDEGKLERALIDDMEDINQKQRNSALRHDHWNC